VIPSFLVGPAIGVAITLVGLGGGYGWLKLHHDPAVRAEMAAEIAAVTQAEQIAGQQRATEALQQLAAEFQAREASLSATRERIIRVPITAACVASPAVVAAVASLRRPGAGAGAAPGAGGAAGVPSRAATP
jgi:hypothetical protein